MEHIAITIRKIAPITETVLEEDFRPQLDKISKYLVRHVFEDDKAKPHKHLHGYCCLPKGFLRRKLLYKGFHIFSKPIYDMEGWIRYIEKDLVPETPRVYKIKLV